ncbi:MAG TPA: UvrB/UvrC motif-containing protein [Devosia sp.]|nr:UvrB/UvrC motif-containing protein [Devosia sp.]
MSSQSIQKKVEELTRQMAEAAVAEDYELAARLRDQIDDLKGPSVRKPPPGQMGLGTNIPVAAPPRNWRRPKKPDPMTTNYKPRSR